MAPPPRSIHDIAHIRVPQVFRDYCEPRACGTRPCPLRGDEKPLLANEGPHALAWLAFRGCTISLAGRDFPRTPLARALVHGRRRAEGRA